MRAVERNTEEPSLHDSTWREFVLAKEANSEWSSRNWRRYRRGLSGLRAQFNDRVPVAAMEKALAEDAFYCATYYQPRPTIVRRAVGNLFRHRLGAREFAYAVAEYWKWANEHSTTDLANADRLVGEARAAIGQLDHHNRRNLERMFAVVVDGMKAQRR